MLGLAVFDAYALNFRSTEKVAVIANQVLHNNFSSINFKPFSIDKIHSLVEQGYKVLTNSADLMELINKYESQFHKDIVETSFYTYSIGQEIMILRNDAKNGVYNGNICKIKGIAEREIVTEVEKENEEEIERDPTIAEFFSGIDTKIKEKKITVTKHTRVKKVQKVVIEKKNGETFEYSLVKSANYFQPAFALTIHKSQGSEFPKVAIALDNKQKLLNSNLLYTAITRAKNEFEVFYIDGVDIEALKEKQMNDDKYSLLDIR